MQEIADYSHSVRLRAVLLYAYMGIISLVSLALPLNASKSVEPVIVGQTPQLFLDDYSIAKNRISPPFSSNQHVIRQ